MRCPSCGTQNEPNSRFCGGCGARLSAGQSGLAPTQKITTGANEVQPRAPQVTPVPGTPVPGAASAPAPAIPTTPTPGTRLEPVTVRQRPAGANAPRSNVQQSAPLAPGAPAAPIAPSIPGTPPPGGYGAAAAPLLDAPRGSEPPRIATSARGVPGPGAIPGTSGAPRPVSPSVGPIDVAPPRRRWGLILGLLVLDLGLAAAGAWMLSEGLTASDAPAPPPARSAPEPPRQP